MMKSIVLWIIAVVLTLASITFQRLTGPTHPTYGSVTIGGQKIKYSLPRSATSTMDEEIKVKATDLNITGQIRFRRYKSYDEWTTAYMKREGDNLSYFIPKQPMAGKVMYQVTLTDQAGNSKPLTDEPVIMRFKDPVPDFILFPHIFFMLAWMFMATRTGLQAFVRGKSLFKYTLVTTIFVICGGLILGPLVQKFAFHAFWTGWPIGHDLTDNKTIIAFIFWVIALWRVKKGRGRGWVIAAAVLTLVVYLIPHSTLGSEIDYTKLPQAGN